MDQKYALGFKDQRRGGFTLIELLIALSIGILLMTFAGLSLRNIKKQQALDNEAATIVALLRSAQEKSFSQESGSRWGVYFANNASPSPDFYYLFWVDATWLANYQLDPNTIPTDEIVDQRKLDRTLDFQTPGQGSNVAVIFNSLSGKPNAAQSIVIIDPTNNDTKTIQVDIGGRIEF